MSSAIQNIMQRALGDGARATKFDVVFLFTNPKAAPDNNQVAVMVKAASMPGKSHTTAELKFKGRPIPVRGQTKYDQNWECSFYLTEDHRLKYAFENWMEALDEMHNYVGNDSTPELNQTKQMQSRNGYVSDIVIYQRNFDDDESTAKYTLKNAFPITVAPIQYSYESVATVQELNITFAYSHFLVENVKGNSGNFIDTIVGKLETAGAGGIKTGVQALGTSILHGLSIDSVGSALGDLNAIANGMNIGNSTPNMSDSTVSKLMNGGLGPDSLPVTEQQAAGTPNSGSSTSISSAIGVVVSNIVPGL